MNQTLQVPDELYRSLKRYASARHETVEEALAALLRDALAEEIAEDSTAAAKTGAISRSGGPWDGLFGAFESPYPDLVARHDYYVGNEAPDTPEDAGQDGADAQS